MERSVVEFNEASGRVEHMCFGRGANRAGGRMSVRAGYTDPCGAGARRTVHMAERRMSPPKNFEYRTGKAGVGRDPRGRRPVSE